MFETRSHLEKSAMAIMARTAEGLETEAKEQGSLDGFHSAPDTFTASVAPRLWAGCSEFNKLGDDPVLLRAEEDTLTAHRQEAERAVIAFRQRYQHPAGTISDSEDAFSWRASLTVALLGLIAGLGLYQGGVPMTVPFMLLIGAVTAVAAINRSYAPQFALWVRDYAVYRRALWRSHRIEREIDRVRVRLLAGMERRHYAEHWAQDTANALMAVYRLHRGRGEKAAQLAA